jgi:hypothetical protein
MTTATGYPHLEAIQVLASVFWVVWIRKISAADPFPAISG